MIDFEKEYPALFSLLPKTFTNLDEANAEIIKLRDEIDRLRLANALLQKKPPGRPKKPKGFNFSMLFGLGGNYGGILPKNKGGRPRKFTKADMLEELEVLDNWKEKLKNERSLSKVTDKQAITILVKEKLKKERSDKQELAIKNIIRFYKYFRDETGIRQRSKKSGKLTE